MATAGTIAGGALALQSSTASAAPLAFNPIAPYRSVDTRAIPGLDKLAAGQFDDWDVWTDEFGNPRIPSSAGAITFNLTITQTEPGGFLSIYPANTGFPGVSNINWVGTNIDLANGGTVALGPSSTTGVGSVSVFCGGGRTHYIIDVTGYFA